MFVKDLPESDALRARFEAEHAKQGYVMGYRHLWAWVSDVEDLFLAARTKLMDSTTLSSRERAVVVCAAVSGLGDSYCSLAWGKRLSDESAPDTAAAVITTGDATALTDRERALAAWARRVVRDPNATTSRDVEELRAAGLSEREIVEATVLTAFRVAFSMVNDALGASPDRQVADAAPEAVRRAVTFGRPASQTASK